MKNLFEGYISLSGALSPRYPFAALRGIPLPFSFFLLSAGAAGGQDQSFIDQNEGLKVVIPRVSINLWN